MPPYAKSEITQEKLLRTTARLLRTRGYAATGLRDILAESGVPRGSLYHQFPGGKEELACASIRASGEAMVAHLRELLERAGDPASAVRAFCDGYAEHLERTGFRAGCPLATVALESADIEPVRSACSDAFADLTGLLAAALAERGFDTGAAADAAVLTVAAIEGGLLLAKARRSTAPLRTVRDRLTRDLEDPTGSASSRSEA